MMRGTFGNIRLANKLVPGVFGGHTLFHPLNEKMTIYDAAMKYKEDNTQLVILAGSDYGMGSSRDWAAKGAFLQGVKAVIAQSFERIHRSNLCMMGVLPLTFAAGQTWESLGLSGHESFDIPVDDNVKPSQEITVTATDENGKKTQFTATVRLDTPVEVDYYRNGGILQTVLRGMLEN